MIVTVHVAVALHRPPGEHEWRRYVVEADTVTQGRLIACQMAQCTSVMAVRAEVIEVVE